MRIFKIPKLSQCCNEVDWITTLWYKEEKKVQRGSVYIKCGRKGYFTKNYKGGQQNYIVKDTNILKDDDWVKVIKEYLIKYFAFYYNSACRVYKDTKYGAGWWLQELEINHAKAIRELDDEQDRIYYRINIYGSFASLELVIYLIKEVDETVSDNKIF